MKILFSNKTLYPFEGGADISALTLLEKLSEENDIVAVYIGEKLNNSKIKCYPQKIRQKKGVWINSYYLNKKWENILSKIVQEEKPDFIITQDYLISSSVKVAKEFNIKSVVFLRSYLHLSIDGFISHLPEEGKLGKSSNIFYKLQYPFYKYVTRETQYALRNADLVCSVSEYMKDVTQKYYNVSSEVIRSFVSTDNYNIENNTREYITFINPDIHKGLNLFKKIADEFPNKRFLVVGKDIKINRFNVNVVNWVKDMRNIYSKTRVVLVPSIWPDPCPRVVIESISNGIPCIVTNRGGAKELVGNEGIVVDVNNLQEWVNAIKLLDNERNYNKASEDALKKSKEFDFKVQYKKFYDLLLELY